MIPSYTGMSVRGSQFGGVGSAYETVGANGHLFKKGTQNHCTACCVVASDPGPGGVGGVL